MKRNKTKRVPLWFAKSWSLFDLSILLCSQTNCANSSNHREHTILLRERVNKGAKRINGLPLPPVIISYATLQEQLLCRAYLLPAPSRSLQNFFGLHITITGSLGRSLQRFVEPKTDVCEMEGSLSARWMARLGFRKWDNRQE